MKLQLILELSKKIKVYCDHLNWILQVGNVNNRFYYSTLDALCRDLFDQRLKLITFDHPHRKDIDSLLELVHIARDAVKEDLKRLEKVMINADRARQRGNFWHGVCK